ncbi:MAG: T9SS type A sorting domain-containing protein [Saprospiraceae bacterium]|nr:T9SS type A sorting domain-containing protein [Saprospiraceae bacterium]
MRNNYIHSFCTVVLLTLFFCCAALAQSVEYLVVAGGGGGASGGGGGGGVLTGTTSVSAGQSYTVTVGAGGNAGTGITRGTNGGNSVFGSTIAIGGGAGGGYTSDTPNAGGSGGGGGFDQPSVTVATGTLGQGYSGGRSGFTSYGAGGGGGGAGAAGSNASTLHIGGAGGNGIASSISGTTTYYGGGGGGGINDNIQPVVTANGGGAGGLGGGGNGSSMGWGSGAYFNGTSGATNTGGGGGGTDPESTLAGNGGSGIVIIRYLGTPIASGGTITQANGYTIHTFSTVGTFSLDMSAVLTAELLTFKGQHTDPKDSFGKGGNVLTWSTANEQNINQFEVERSSNGVSFQKIGEVKAKGSNSIYRFLDESRILQSYYRLKMVDVVTNKVDYSKIISIESKGATKVRIYPSVTNGQLIVEGAASFEIVNSIGQIQKVGVGIRYLNLDLPNGLYIIRGVDTEGIAFSQKIIKQ